MPNKTKAEKAALLEEVTGWVMLGIDEPYQMMQLVPTLGNNVTAKKYIALAKPKIAAMLKSEDKVKILERQQSSIRRIRELAIQKMKNADNDNAYVGALNTFIRMLEFEANLLGLEAPSELLVGSKDDQGENLADILKALPEKDAKAVIKKLNEGRRKLSSA